MNWNDLKFLPKKDLVRLIPGNFEFFTSPWTHQIAFFLAAIANYRDSGDGFIGALDMGTGKTKVAIDLYRYFESKRALVVCLNSAVENWVDEVHRHSGPHKVYCLRGSVEDKWGIMDAHPEGMFIINFEGLRALVARRKEVAADFKGKHTEVDKSCITKLLGYGFDMLVIDESHKVKSHASLNFKILSRLAAYIPKRILLTGTPFGNSLLDVWAQYYLADKGKCFGDSFSRYRFAYFEDKNANSKWKNYPEWVAKPGSEDVLRERLFAKAIRYTEDEVGELPEKVYRTLRFALSKEQRQVYDEAVDGILKMAGHMSPLKLANKAMVLRQICSGFIKVNDSAFRTNPKLDVLWDLLDGTIENHKVVIFHEFIKEGLMIEGLLHEHKVKYNSLNSSVKDKHREYTQFQEDARCRVMVAHPLSGGSSINLYAASYCVFFSNGYKVIDRLQCEKRVHRAGQQSSHVFYYDLIATGTIETSIQKRLSGKIDVFSGIMKSADLSNLLKGSI